MPNNWKKILKMITTHSILHISDQEEKGQRLLRTATSIQTPPTLTLEHANDT